MPDVSDLVATLVRHVPRAVIPIANIAMVLGVEQAAVSDLAREAESLDRAYYWSDLDSVVLSTTEAERHRLELRCPDTEEINPQSWKWVRLGSNWHPESVVRGTGFGGDYDLAAQVTTRHHFPDEDDPVLAWWLRQVETIRRKRPKEGRTKLEASLDDFLEGRSVENTPKINVVGVGLAWSQSLEVTGNPNCQVCRGRELGLLGFCLGCSRSGLDDRFKAPVASNSRKSTKPDPKGLAGGKGKRKAVA